MSAHSEMIASLISLLDTMADDRVLYEAMDENGDVLTVTVAVARDGLRSGDVGPFMLMDHLNEMYR